MIFLPLNKKLDVEHISERTSKLFEPLRIFNNMIMGRVRFMFRVEVESFFNLFLVECETSLTFPYTAYNF